MKCPNCNTENRFDAVICASCGTSLLDAPADEPIDLDRFAPAHSDPFISAPPPAPVHKAEDMHGDKDTESGNDGLLVKLRDMLESAAEKVGDWLDRASAWIAGKLRQKPDDNEDDEEGENFRKVILAIMLVVISVIIIILFGFFGACTSCSCASCAPATLTGTWAEASCVQDGYHSSDYIIQLTDEGTLIVSGQNVGTYELSEDMLRLSFNGLEYSGTASADAEELSVALHGYSSVTLNLVKLTDETGLTASELAGLYPDEK